MRLLIVVLFALLAAVLVPLIAHSKGLSWSGTCDTRWREVTGATPACGDPLPVAAGQRQRTRAGSPTT